MSGKAPGNHCISIHVQPHGVFFLGETKRENQQYVGLLKRDSQIQGRENPTAAGLSHQSAARLYSVGVRA